MDENFFDSSEVVTVTKNLNKNKGKKKKRKGDKGNEKECKRPLDDISADARIMIRSVQLGSQCG